MSAFTVAHGATAYAIHPHALHQVPTVAAVLWLLVVLPWAGEVSVHAGGHGRQASPSRPGMPLKRLGSGGPES